jgi:hypothetical protein
VVGRCAGRCAGTEEEAIEKLGRLEQANKGTWESQDDVECEKAKQDNIYMKHEDGDSNEGHDGRMGALLSQTEMRR